MHFHDLSLQSLLGAIDHVILGRPIVSLLLISAGLIVTSILLQKFERREARIAAKGRVLHQRTEDGSL